MQLNILWCDFPYGDWLDVGWWMLKMHNHPSLLTPEKEHVLKFKFQICPLPGAEPPAHRWDSCIAFFGKWAFQQGHSNKDTTTSRQQTTNKDIPKTSHMKSNRQTRLELLNSQNCQCPIGHTTSPLLKCQPQMPGPASMAHKKQPSEIYSSIPKYFKEQSMNQAPKETNSK